MDEQQPNVKKIICLIVGGILAIVLLVWLWNYFHTGKIIIKTSSRYNEVILTKAAKDGGQAAAKTYKGKGNLSVDVRSGNYTVSVKGNSIATTQAVAIKARHTQQYTINPVDTTGIEPVAYANAQDVSASSGELVYLDPSSGMLESINDQDHVTEINSPYKLQHVQWLDPSFGIGKSSDEHLYSILDGSVKPLEVPFQYDGEIVSFDISPDKKVYISHGADVYKSAQNGNFKKIYTASSSKPVLAAANSSVAVSDSKYGPNGSNISKPLLASMQSSGKEKKINIESERLAWSPDGRYLTTVNQSSPVIYDASLRKIATIQTDSVVGQFAWLNNGTLLYTLNSELWTYNVAQQKAQLLSNTPLADSITGLSVSEDGSYIYLTTSSAIASGSAIKRVGLKGQPVPDYIYRLQDILPESLSSYSINLVNFSGTPSIVVRPYPGAPNANYIQQAQTELQSRGFNNSGFTFQLAQPITSSD